MVCGCSGRDNNVISSEKVILPTYNLHTAFSPSARFVAKVAYFQTPYIYMGKNDFVGSNEHNPWVLYIKLHLKMSGDVNFSHF